MAKKIKKLKIDKKASRKLFGIAKKTVKKAAQVKPTTAPVKIDTKTWEEAATSLKAAEKKPDPKKAIPVESHLPGIARSPKPIKRHVPIAAPKGPLGADHLDTLEIISYHFLKLMERLAAEHGGTSTQALEDLRADIAKRKP